MTDTVPVNVWAKRYEFRFPIADADVVDMATGDRWKTGKDGYAKIMAEPGRVLSLEFQKAKNPTVQAGTVTVPTAGLTTQDDEITLQVPGRFVYGLLRLAFGNPKQGKHHVVATVAASGANLHNDHGETGTKVVLRSADGKTVRDDAIYVGSIFGKTEWVRPILTTRIPFLKALRRKKTSHDGGLAFRNVPPGEYTLEASKTGKDGNPVKFENAQVTVFDNSPNLINVSTPRGPRVVGP